MSESNISDRRRNRRAAVDIPIALEDATGRIACRLRNISRNGASATTNRPLDELSMVNLDLTLVATGLPEVRITCRAAVVRCDSTGDDSYELGLYFMDLSDEGAEDIDRFVDAAAGLGYSSP